MKTENKLSNTSLQYSQWFLIVTAIFITCLIKENIAAVKLMNIFGVVLPAAIISFPLSYSVGDILTEMYGSKYLVASSTAT